jgi:UDPglucose 6-dehydrogenase
MKTGIIGCGKLGLMVGLAIEDKGHEVKGYDVNPQVADYLKLRSIPFKEVHSERLLAQTKMEMVDLTELVNWADLLFIAVQTPHDPLYEGATRIPNDRKDFDYTYIKQAVEKVNSLLTKPTDVAIISTMLPGTTERELRPLMGEYFNLVYTPQFIAMGTVYDDYTNPEFNLIGVDKPEVADRLKAFYKTINNAPMVKTDITTAEGIKVSYNTFITMKTVLGNIWGELSDKIGMNFDDIFGAWSLSTRRLLSPLYLRAGMGDGGGCHPRDNIALSYIAQKYDLSHNLFEDLMKSREQTEEWHAFVTYQHAQRTKLPVIVLGRSFKPETNIETGSPAVLMATILNEYGIVYDHVEDIEPYQAVYFIGTKHSRYADYKYPQGSVVIDPHGYIPKQDGVDVIYLGRNMV